MKTTLSVLLLVSLAFAARAQSALSAPASAHATAAAALPPDANAKKARTLLDDMVRALGGLQWLHLSNTYVAGNMAAFYHGKPTGVNTRYWEWSTPTETRIDLTEKTRDAYNWVQIYTGNQCWEITYQGRKPMNKKVCDDAIRRRDHSLRAAVQVWMKQPSTLLLYDGQALSERHLADRITLLNADNDAITIETDFQTHLPLSVSWSWRDPVYHDKDTEKVEFADYHTVNGLPTPYTITCIDNGDMVQQRFIYKAAFNVQLPPYGFDLDALARSIVKW